MLSDIIMYSNKWEEICLVTYFSLFFLVSLFSGVFLFNFSFFYCGKLLLFVSLFSDFNRENLNVARGD